jgi:hypothetical protein
MSAFHHSAGAGASMSARSASPLLLRKGEAFLPRTPSTRAQEGEAESAPSLPPRGGDSFALAKQRGGSLPPSLMDLHLACAAARAANVRAEARLSCAIRAIVIFTLFAAIGAFS